MITFIISIILLLLGYLLYSKLIQRVIGVDPARTTPAVAHPDGVDYVPMKPWRIFLIQFLNIAGVGPICGAIMGAQFGTASFLWIVFGCIFAGAVHDFIAGFISIRQDGASLPEIHGKYLGNGMKQFMRGFTVLLMILVGAVFVNTPAVLLNQNFTPEWNIFIWVGIIFAYYLIATLLPIDKLIGRIYPVFGMLLLGMAVAIIVAFIVYKPDLPEVWTNLSNQLNASGDNTLFPRMQERTHRPDTPLFPMMFISIACGAISGFHATQSPLMARCMVNEKQSRPIFYGAMITEGVVALIWAAAATVFYHDPILSEHTMMLNDKGETVLLGGNAMVGVIAYQWFPKVIAIICILGVISAAVTSGDTALRSARLIVADFMHVDQKPIPKRLMVALPVFILAAGLLVFSLANPLGFDYIWRYFAWANQVLAMVTLWAITVFLSRTKKGAWYWISLVPALFMSMVTISFLLVAQKEGLGSVLPRSVGYGIAAAITALLGIFFFVKKAKRECDDNKTN
ncbi:MAG: carbon starvation protein A [Bacteroidales bacterium]|nr:carbon starvation protein A [Bacteroidales bacterium]